MDGSRVDSLCCNLGYARGECARFPQGDGPDAVRFTITGEDDSGVRVYYVMERNHLPFAHGALGEGAGADAVLTRQAAAYVESYHRRKGTH